MSSSSTERFLASCVKVNGALRVAVSRIQGKLMPDISGINPGEK